MNLNGIDIAGQCSSGGIPKLTLSCVQNLIKQAIGFGIGFVGIVSVIFIIIAGIMFITSGGGKQVETAKNMLTYAIIGLVIVLLSIFIIGLTTGLAGVTCVFSQSCGIPG